MVTDIGTNRKLIYDLLLVINTNLHTILHHLTLMLSLGVIPCQYHHKYIAKNQILWATFPLQKVLAYLQPLLRNPPQKLPNSLKLRSR